MKFFDRKESSANRREFRRVFLILLIASVALSALVGIGVLLFGNFGSVEVRILMTTLTITVMSIFGLACGAYLESGRGRSIPLTGIFLSVGAAVMALLIIWDALDDSPVFIKSFLSATLLAAGGSHFCLLSLARLDRRFAWTRMAAGITILLLSSIVLYIVWAEPHGDSDLIFRILGVLGIVLAAITVITPVLHKLSSAGASVEALDKEITGLKKRLQELEEERAHRVSE